MLMRDWAKMGGFAAILAVVLALSCLWALDYIPQNSEWTCKPKTSTNQPSTNSNEAFVCRLAQTENLNQETDATNSDSSNHFFEGIKITDVLLAAFTGLLVLVGGFQAYWLLGTVEATSKAANAADLSARAAIAIELPVIRVRPEHFGWGRSQEQDGPRIDYCAVGMLDFSNLGRTQAFPLEVQLGWFVGDKLPDTPTYTFSKSFPIGRIFEPDPQRTPELTLYEHRFQVDSDLFDRLRARSVSMWFFCSLAYLDFMQNRHDAGFCWQRWENFGGGVFAADATPAYNRKT
jgi:hypothetical protein